MLIATYAGRHQRVTDGRGRLGGCGCRQRGLGKDGEVDVVVISPHSTPFLELSGVGFSSPLPLGEGQGEGGMVASHRTPHPRPLPMGEGERPQGQCRV
jgi:hypothetical protein